MSQLMYIDVWMKIDWFKLLFQTLSVSVSVTTLSAISVERYFVICHPLKLRFTPSTIAVCIVAIWLSGILIALPELIYQSLNRTLDKNITDYLLYCKMSMSESEVKGYQTFLLTTLYFIPMCLMAFTYSNISHRLWKNNIPGTDVAGKLQDICCKFTPFSEV